MKAIRVCTLHDHLRHRAEAGRIVRARISAGDPVNVGRVPTGLPADLLLHHTPCPETCAADHPARSAAAHLFHAGDPKLHGLLDCALRHSVRHLLSQWLHCGLVPPMAAAGVPVLPCRTLLAGLLHRPSGPAALSSAVPAAACLVHLKSALVSPEIRRGEGTFQIASSITSRSSQRRWRWSSAE